MIAQFKHPPTKSHQLSSYCGESYVQDGYELDYTANTKNTEGTFVSVAGRDTEFDANASIDSNGEIEATLQSELTFNAAVSKKHSPKTMQTYSSKIISNVLRCTS